jgi:hypothetical protein
VGVGEDGEFAYSNPLEAELEKAVS